MNWRSVLPYGSLSSILACNSKIAQRHTSTSSSTEGGSEPHLLFWQRKVVALSQILLDGAEPSNACPGRLLQSAGVEANRILLASALSSMRAVCPNRVSRRDWITSVSLVCFVCLCMSSFRTNWYHVIPTSIRRPH